MLLLYLPHSQQYMHVILDAAVIARKEWVHCIPVNLIYREVQRKKYIMSQLEGYIMHGRHDLKGILTEVYTTLLYGSKVISVTSN